MTLVSTTITVWTDVNGIPQRFVWEGARYRVTDTPTPLVFEPWQVTHPAAMPNGWRLQGTNGSGESLIFDLVERTAGSEWHALHTYC